MVIEAIGRRLRLAVIGGGPGSVIGEVHRIAARLDGYYDIVASALSSEPERARQSGHAIGVPEDRAYSSWQALIENEARRSDRPDVIAVMTPNEFRLAPLGAPRVPGDLILEPSGLAEDEVLLEVEGCADPIGTFRGAEAGTRAGGGFASGFYTSTLMSSPSTTTL